MHLVNPIAEAVKVHPPNDRMIGVERISGAAVIRIARAILVENVVSAIVKTTQTQCWAILFTFRRVVEHHIGNLLDDVGKCTAFLLGDASTRMAGKAPHVHLIYDRPRGGPIEWCVAFPIVCMRIYNDALHRHRGIVTFPLCRFATVVLRNYRGASIWVDEDFVRIEAHSTTRIKWPLNSIAVDLTCCHTRYEDMPV